MYSSPYANNIPNMSNSEVVCLAKNRFTDEETQLAIAKHWYKLGKEYLARNPKLSPEAAQEMWSHRGYVLKASMMSQGTIKLTPEVQTETYRQYFKGRRRRQYRMFEAFLSGYSYWSGVGGKNDTPPDLIEEIYEDYMAESNADDPSVYELRRFLKHQNCPQRVALKIATMKLPETYRGYHLGSFERLKEEAMLVVAEITKRESAVSR